MNEKVFFSEEQFHDEWANRVDVNKIDIISINEAITSPELRYITNILGNVKGKKILDIGCGLGEASIYFAIKGADVTSSDISDGMLKVANALANIHKVYISTYKSTSESLYIPGKCFDIIYVGNLFHHVEIKETLSQIVKMMHEHSILASWDPIAYNPLINLYRKIATKVRTKDEHPLTFKDLKEFKNHFEEVKYKYFWFFTLIIFIIMACVQLRNPNKVRYWKKVVEEANKWKYIYLPLKFLDDLVLKIFPFLKLFCWNVVVIATKPKNLK